ncbi:MAG TPA: fibronectin type III domain-containing protein [Arcobacter sp.]|nr:fibronectin type III domain-containing protein [Arcobacter sp.]HIP55844.1 fibronectin type III domain-containing protein [Arcobacter sp.]
MRKLTKALLLTALIMWMSGCSLSNNLGSPNLSTPKIDVNLPTIDSQSIKSIPGITNLALEWVGTTKAGTYGYHIYRSDIQKSGEKLSRIASIKNRYSSHYVDNNLEPATQYLYAISVIGANGTESTPSSSTEIYTLPIFDSVSLISSVSNLPRQVKVIWRPHSNHAVNSYILERSSPKNLEWKKVKEIKGRLNPEYIDMDLKDNLTYSYRLKAVTYDGITSKLSAVTKATTKPLPTSVGQVEATTDLPRKIIVTWQASTSDDIIAYNIYSSSNEKGSFSKIGTAKKDDNTFEHIINEDDKTGFYKISALDKDNLESDIEFLPVAQGKTLSAPGQPIVRLAMIKGEEVVLNWDKGDDRAVAYNVYKTTKESFFKSTLKVFKNIQDIRFEDKDIVRGLHYTYEIEAVDENGLVSKKVEAASLKLEQTKKNK